MGDEWFDGCFLVVCKVGDVEIQLSGASISLDKVFARSSPSEKGVLCGACIAYDLICWWIVPMVSDRQNICTLSELSVLLSQRSADIVVVVWLGCICWRKSLVIEYFYRADRCFV